ncbi:putative candidate secreted effector protein [Blumeria hordei DH14]|nr:putative candidate secreted effector protein [Blumeria hordei DH14]
MSSLNRKIEIRLLWLLFPAQLIRSSQTPVESEIRLFVCVARSELMKRQSNDGKFMD